MTRERQGLFWAVGRLIEKNLFLSRTKCREFLIRSWCLGPWKVFIPTNPNVLFLTDKVALIFPIAFSPTKHRFGKISILLSIIIFTDIFWDFEVGFPIS